MDEYNKMEKENNTLFITIYTALLMTAYSDFSTAQVTCNLSIFDQQLDWANFVDHHGSQSCFDRHLRMKKLSFDKFLEYIQLDLKVDPKMAYLWGESFFQWLHYTAPFISSQVVPTVTCTLWQAFLVLLSTVFYGKL
jgi:hypothetical protein